MTNEYWNGLKAISTHYGRETQRIKLIEELGELVTALAKDESFSDIADEIADVEVLLTQYKLEYNAFAAVDRVKEMKVRRQLDRIREECHEQE